MDLNIIYNASCLDGLKQIPDSSVNCCVTSPPYYGLRDYGVDNQIGLEDTPEEYINKLVEVFREIKRVLKDDGTLWVNMGDSYAGSNQGAGTKVPTSKQASNKGTNFMTTVNHTSKLSKLDGYKPKDLIGTPWMLAFALRNDGWYLRNDIIWAKGNPMPESVKDRCTRSHEYIFLLSKSKKYYFDYVSIKEPCVSKQPAGNKKAMNQGRIGKEGWSFDSEKSIPKDGRNKRDVWNVNTKPYKEAHFATFPPDLILPCILAGCPENGIVIDPFMGSGTVGLVAKQNNRNYIGIEINKDYCKLAERRILAG
jgi:DNA modification methylase